jgi:catechol 2,3-dioxygenase-like lactoylglutathione lyase family enzyme
MNYEGLNHVIVAAPSPEAVAPFERLGLRVLRLPALPNAGMQIQVIAAGGRTNLFSIVFYTITDAAAAAGNGLGRLISEAAAKGPGIAALAVRVAGLHAAVKELAERGVKADAEELVDPSGRKVLDFAVLPESKEACVRIALFEPVESVASRHDVLEQQGLLAHTIELKRLDHLAAVAPDLEKITRFWQDVLHIPVFGELIGGGGNIIRQMKVGDAIVELLGPSGPDSPLLGRPPGLNSMTAWEVPDLKSAVETARLAGFEVTDPAIGTLPGTRVARIPGEQLSGITLQLLEYV